MTDEPATIPAEIQALAWRSQASATHVSTLPDYDEVSVVVSAYGVSSYAPAGWALLEEYRSGSLRAYNTETPGPVADAIRAQYLKDSRAEVVCMIFAHEPQADFRTWVVERNPDATTIGIEPPHKD